MPAIPRKIEVESPYSVIGVSHKTLGVEQRERLARFAPKTAEDLRKLNEKLRVPEIAVISTCNRFEVIVAEGSSSQDVAGYLAADDWLKIPEKAIYQFKREEAVRHLFRVASSLDSMVLGEAQILGQVKDAYELAVESGGAGRHLHQLFQFTFQVAKRVRNATELGSGGVSISYVAVKLAQQIVGELQDARVLVIGSGRMAELAVMHLKAYGCSGIVVANRTISKASALAGQVGGSAVSLSEIEREAAQADIVIGSISVDRPLIPKASLQNRTKPLFMIDLGMPRNFPANLGELDSVYLYNIDDLAAISKENEGLRREAVADAELLVEYGVFRFKQWLLKLSKEPVLLSFRDFVRSTCDSELSRVGAGLSAEKLEILSHRISQKISHQVTQQLIDSDDSVMRGEGLLPFVFDSILKDD